MSKPLDRIEQVNGVARYFLGHKEVTEAQYRAEYPAPTEHGIPGGMPLKGWPIISDALAVHPKQVAEHEALCRSKGVPTQTLKDGRVILRDRAHRKQYLKAFNYHDRNGSYGD